MAKGQLLSVPSWTLKKIKETEEIVVSQKETLENITINGKPLTENINLTAEDVNAENKGAVNTHNTSVDAHNDIRQSVSELQNKVDNIDVSAQVTSGVSIHNVTTNAHNDIRLLITELTNRLNALADSDDDTLDQMKEVVDYIKANRELIESVTTTKVNVSDIIDNLTTNVSNRPLSAAQGVALKGLIDILQTEVNSKASSVDLTTHTNNSKIHVTEDDKTNWNNKLNKTVTDLGIMGGKTITDLKSTLNNWILSNYDIPNARASFSGDIGSIMNLWNSNNLSDTINNGRTITAEIETYYVANDYTMIKFTTYAPKEVYYVSKQDGYWDLIYKVAFTGDKAADSEKLDGLNSTNFSRANDVFSFGQTNTAMTTNEFLDLLETLGAFKFPHWTTRGTWSYAENRYINDTGCGNIHLAGCAVEVFGSKNYCTIRVNTATTSTNDNTGVCYGDFIYVNNGSEYNPGWRRLYNTKFKPTIEDLGITTSLNTLNGLQAIADNNQFCKAVLSARGWYRIAEYKYGDSNNESQRGVFGNSCEIIIKKSYMTNPTEEHRLLLKSRFGVQKFVSISNFSYETNVINKIRYVYNSTTAYIDVYYNATSENATAFLINDGKDYSAVCWKITNPVLVEETVAGETASTVYNIPANADPVNSLDLKNTTERSYKQTIDLSDTTVYDENTWYPCTGNAMNHWSKTFYRINVSVHLNTNVPTWAVHENGFSCDLDLLVKPQGWGTTNGECICLNHSYKFSELDPCGFAQMGNSSTPVLYLRGGGNYYVYTSYECEWTPRTAEYTASNETIKPLDSSPGATISKSTIHANLKGNADTATAANMAGSVVDYNDPSKNGIRLGYAGDGLTTDQAVHLAAYANIDGERVIKDFSFDNLMTKIGLLRDMEKFPVTYGFAISKIGNTIGVANGPDNYYMLVDSNNDFRTGVQLNGASEVTWTKYSKDGHTHNYATPDYVNSAIQTAIGNAMSASY